MYERSPPTSVVSSYKYYGLPDEEVVKPLKSNSEIHKRNIELTKQAEKSQELEPILASYAAELMSHMSKSAWNSIDHETKRITQNNLVTYYEKAIAKNDNFQCRGARK